MSELEHNTNDTPLERRLERLLQDATTHSGTRIPDRVDRAVLAMAAAKTAQIRRTLWRDRAWRLTRYAAAVAAVLLLFAGLTQHLVDNRAPPSERPVDIVDAYLLARTLASGERPSADEDHNGDGRVDAADVDRLARTAVSLGPPREEERSRDA